MEVAPLSIADALITSFTCLLYWLVRRLTKEQIDLQLNHQRQTDTTSTLDMRCGELGSKIPGKRFHAGFPGFLGSHSLAN